MQIYPIHTDEFKIDYTNSDNEFLYIDVPNANKTIAIQIDNDEIILEIYPMYEVVDAIKTIKISK